MAARLGPLMFSFVSPVCESGFMSHEIGMGEKWYPVPVRKSIRRRKRILIVASLASWIFVSKFKFFKGIGNIGTLVKF
jgi:hypothetical protein